MLLQWENWNDFSCRTNSALTGHYCQCLGGGQGMKHTEIWVRNQFSTVVLCMVQDYFHHDLVSVPLFWGIHVVLLHVLSSCIEVMTFIRFCLPWTLCVCLSTSLIVQELLTFLAKLMDFNCLCIYTFDFVLFSVCRDIKWHLLSWLLCIHVSYHLGRVQLYNIFQYSFIFNTRLL